MKKYIVLGIIFFLTGCVPKTQMMINASGTMMKCYSYDAGSLGIPMAFEIQNDCTESSRKAGYLELERAGVVGLTFNQDDPPTVIKVENNSPAQKEGIVPGDKVIAVNGQSVKKVIEVKALLFGPIGTQVEILTVREGIEKAYTLILTSYVDIYGTPKKQ
jgi:C-terminal processing protease CtpA/Prc